MRRMRADSPARRSAVQRRLGETEHVERSEGRDLGLRVFLGQRAAIVSSSTIDPASFTELAERAVAMARVVPEDPYAGLADTAAPPEPGRARPGGSGRARHRGACRRARAAAEEAALAVPGITNSEGAEAGFGRSRGIPGHLGRLCRPSRAHQPLDLGHRAGGQPARRCSATTTTIPPSIWRTSTIRRRSAAAPASAPSPGSIPARPATAKLPVVYDPRVAGGLLGHLAGAINGASVARGTTFLKDRLGQRVFAAGHRDPRRSAPGPRPALPRVRRRGHADRGARTDRRRRADDAGCSTAARPASLACAPPGHAARGTGGPPSPRTDQPVSRRRRADAGGTDGGHQARRSTSPS